MKKILILMSMWVFLLSCGCSKQTVLPESSPEMAPALTPAPIDTDCGKLIISELMPKNQSVLRDEDGDFSDWIELENVSDEELSLSGWHISDDSSKGWALPDISLPAGEKLLVFASGKNKGGAELHADFKLSERETVRILSPMLNESHSVNCSNLEADYALALKNGEFTVSMYPTPGYDNSPEGYELWQSGRICAGPLVINEVMSANIFGATRETVGKLDWVEIKNISGETIDLSGYYLSDDNDNYRLWQLPNRRLKAGGTFIIVCDPDNTSPYPNTGFGLNSTMEQLFLSDENGIIDYMTIRDLQPNMSYGRMDGEAGHFFFEEPSFNLNNGSGIRYISQMPVSESVDGVFNDVESVTVEFSAPGTIHYTTDGSLPTEKSPVYTGPITVTETCVVRAISIEDGALPSRALTLSYIINEYHSLPVASLTADSPHAVKGIYMMGIKYEELPGNISFYEPDGSFSIGCGISITGHDSLRLAKKSIKVNFRGVYGDEKLEYDLFNNPLQEFSSLALRSGQDSHRLIFRQEIWQDLCLEMTDDVLTQHSKFCVLYINGEYYGIYCIKENISASYYADKNNVSKNSVESDVMPDDLLEFCCENDLSIPENYQKLCNIVDIDSLIDWLILEGVSANVDLYINTRFFRSPETDGKWQAVLFDLDHTMLNDFSESFVVGISPQEAYFPFATLMGDSYFASPNMTKIFKTLLSNQDFLHSFLCRYAEVYNSTLSNDRILERIDHYQAILEPEVKRDWEHWDEHPENWYSYVEHLRNDIVEYDWQNYAKDSLAHRLGLSPEQMAKYFGE